MAMRRASLRWACRFRRELTATLLGLLVAVSPKVEAQDAAEPGRERTEGAAWDIDLSTRQELPLSEFLETSSLFYDLPNIGPEKNKPLVFEAQLAPHLFFYNSLSALERQNFDAHWDDWGPDGWMFAAAFTFQLRLRMVGDASTPVRPPSFMPRFDLQAFKVLAKHEAQEPTRDSAFDLLELRLTPWGHHSNGQQYCSFAEGVLDAPEEGSVCPEVDVRQPPQDLLNHRAGDFATNYFIVGGHLARIWVDRSNFFEARRMALGLLLEVNPRGYGPGAIDAQQQALYGPYRVRVEGELSWHAPGERKGWTGLVRATGSAEWMFGGEARNVPYDRQMLEVAYIFDSLGGVGFFARGVRGQDYLNILFAQPAIATLQLGIIWHQSPRTKYGFMVGRL
jgi:hypothetical protein